MTVELASDCEVNEKPSLCSPAHSVFIALSLAELLGLLISFTLSQDSQ